jgi:parallel beta-helix repeat protein
MLTGLSGMDAVAAAEAESIDEDVWRIDEQQRLEQWDGYREAKDEGRIVYVAADSSGDFNCDGTEDHIQINEAIERVAADDELTIVHLKGPNTYVISDTIKVGDDTVLQGDADAEVRLKDNVQWPKWKPMIASKHMEPAEEAGVYTRQCPEPIRNVTIRGFDLNGANWANRGKDVKTGEPRTAGKGWDMMILLVNAYNVTVNHMYMHHTLTDALVIRGAGEHRNASINARVFNNRIHALGHDGMYIQSVNDFEIYNNYVTQNRTNSQIRVSGGCNDYSIYNNALHNSAESGFSGNAGIQIQLGAMKGNEVDNVEIYGNDISRMALGGIVVYGLRGTFGSRRGIHIHHNRISDCRIAGIRIYGVHETLIENNVLYGNRGDGILHWYVYGTLPERSRAGAPPEGEKYTTTVRNNIIVNTVLSRAHEEVGSYPPNRVQPEAGFGVNDCRIDYIKAPDIESDHLKSLHQFIVENNCFYNNVNGPYNNVEYVRTSPRFGSKRVSPNDIPFSEASDIYSNPMFVDAKARDFRLKPDSPLIGAGTDGKNIGAY